MAYVCLCKHRISRLLQDLISGELAILASDINIHNTTICCFTIYRTYL